MSLIDQIRCRPVIGDSSVALRVWAPYADSVELELHGNEEEVSRHAMLPEDYGYFSTSLDLNTEDVGRYRYRYRLTKGESQNSYPDPCSLHQPEGVHSWSALFNACSFSWSDSEYQLPALSELVVYELHVGTFTPEGTFQAVIPRLAALKELGITAIELMPVAQFPGSRNWGYDGCFQFAAQNSYGGPLGLQTLVDAAHREGIAVFLDVVLNHFGPEGNYTDKFGPYLSEFHLTPWGSSLNFDGPDSDAVRAFASEVVRHWVSDFHIDGLRLDAVHAMFDTSPVHILADLKLSADQAALERGARAYVIAESLRNDPRILREPEKGGCGLDAEWNEDFHHAVLGYLADESHGKYVDFGQLDHIRRVFEQTFHLDGIYSRFRRRKWGSSAAPLSPEHYLVGIQNHDHVGNRARGDRISEMLSPAKQRLAAALMILSPFVPQLFMGEEYGETNPFQFFVSFSDQKLIQAVRRGRKADYDLQGEVPDPQNQSTFARSRLSWDWQSRERTELRNLYKELLVLRGKLFGKESDDQRKVSFWPSNDEPIGLQILRSGPSGVGRILTLFNLSEVERRIEVAEMTPIFFSEAHRYGGLRWEADGGEGEASLLYPFECCLLCEGTADPLSFSANF